MSHSSSEQRPFPPRERDGGLGFALLAPTSALAATLELSPGTAAVIATAIVAVGSIRALVLRRFAERVAIDDVSSLERQLAAWRRRNETAAILVVEASTGHSARPLVRSLRTTDAVALISSMRGPRLVAALDGHGLDRLGLERRLETVGGGDLRLGWASFPADGTTLEALIDCASAAIGRQAASEGQATDLQAATHRSDWGIQPAGELSGSLAQVGILTRTESAI
jgi:hypothetical protein